ncbi:U-box domain-containing protein 33-like isoform X2 [Macadamia integrifolia]|uniref:U-box domain-containing protein 33-like isoform X2 n=1 Tax=Macadamia integrifolia TaxID=60698 RepID=UPI001C4F8246|nr:U-box domain-containing protein 33-like isoform X2 [Macadamia integrifolia]
MAVVSPIPFLTTQIGGIEIHDLDISGLMDTSGEIEEEPRLLVENKIFVAVGKEVKEGKSTLSWALKNSGGMKICILHVHVPAQMIPMLGGKFPANTLNKQEVMAYRELERKKMHDALNEYLSMCHRAGVRAETIYIEKDNIGEGIVELIIQRGIKKLVMGAAADKHYSRKMTGLKSKKAIFVREKAHVSCHIWFVCKELLMYTREGNLEGSELASPISVTGQVENSRSKFPPSPRGQKHYSKPSNPVQDLLRRAVSINSSASRRGITSFSSSEGTVVAPSALPIQSNGDGFSSEFEGSGTSRRSPSKFSEASAWSSSDVFDTFESFSIVRDGGSKAGTVLYSLPGCEENLHDSSLPNTLLLDEQMNYDIHSQLERAMVEAENSRREAFEECLKRGRAEKDAFEAICKAKASEGLYEKEKKQREELEVLLWKGKQELEMLKIQRDQVMEELRITLDHRSKLESQIADSDQMVSELEEKFRSAVELLVTIRNEREELLKERDNAVREAEELRKTREEEATSSHTPPFFSQFSFLEIDKATSNFHQSGKIGEGGYGLVYRGTLRQTPVAIKLLHRDNLEGHVEFQQEVDVLSRVRHPNLVTLIGACPEAWALIYEYLPNGSLEDRLVCKDGTPPLSWKTRIRIAIEICSALIFLNSYKPHSVIHGDLKPANILLDANFVSKLGDFGISRLIRRPESSNPSTLCYKTSPKGTFAYMDPEFQVTGEMTSKSDIYSFGIIVLRLLTGKPAMGIVKEVQYALEKDNLIAVLDASAGNWPYVQAKQLAHLALRCCEMSGKNRPNLGGEVWRVLEPMGACWGAMSFSRLASGEHCRVPSYFICPIFQEIMQDPHVAADGFTYELEAVRAWLDSGHDTSPMTNLKLNHLSLIPNHALRSAIQEWLEQP